MPFIFPVMGLVARTAVATLTVGEAIGIGCAAFGVGAGIKGAIDYRNAKKLKEEADAEYREMASRIKRRTLRLKKSLESLAS
jgi:uncharacterized protein (UPF0254 family)